MRYKNGRMATSPVIHLGARIRYARRQAEIDQEELGRKIGVNRKTVGRWESGDGQPRALELSAIAEALGVSVAWLLGSDLSDAEGVAS